jgi:hypothetical protein
MKSLKLFLVALTAIAFSFSSYAQTADEIVAKHIEAIGGAEAWKKITSIKREATMSVQGMDVLVKSTIVHGKGSREDISISSMGWDGYYIATPTKGWKFEPWSGQTAADAMTADEIADRQDGLDAQGSLIDYKAKGHSVELVGKENVDGTECFKLKLTLKSGNTRTLFIDPKTYYSIKIISLVKVNGTETEVPSSLSNFKKLPEGIVVAMSATRVTPGGDAEMSFTKIEINQPVDEKIFEGGK